MFLSLFLVGTLVDVVASQAVCHPLNSTCPPNPALNGTLYENFTTHPANWTAERGVEPAFNASGLQFTLSNSGDIGGLAYMQFIMFGHVSAVIKHPAAVGIITRMVLQSNVNDNIQFIWPSGGQGMAQAVSYWHGDEDNNPIQVVKDGVSEYNTYDIDWTAQGILWTINGDVVRELQPSQTTNGSEYPQTPMSLRFEALDGTYWGSEPANWTEGPYLFDVRSVVLTDYSTGSSFTYTDHSGTLASIRSNGGSINSAFLANSTSTVDPTSIASTTTSATETSSTSQSVSPESSGLSTAAKAGIGTGLSAAILAIGMGIIILWRKRKRHPIKQDSVHATDWEKQAHEMGGEEPQAPEAGGRERFHEMSLEQQLHEMPSNQRVCELSTLAERSAISRG